VQQQTRELVRRGHEVHVATHRAPGSLASETIDGVHVHRFIVRGRSVSGISGERAEYLRFVKSRAWDTVAMHYAYIWTTDVLLDELDAIAGRKFLLLQGMAVMGNPRFSDYLSQLALASRRMAAIVAVSSLTEETTFCRAYGIAAPIIIPNGVTPDEWTTPAVGARTRLSIGQKPWAVSVGNHTRAKRHALFFDVISALTDRHPGLVGTLIGNPHRADRWQLGRLGIQGGCWYACRGRALVSPHVELRSNVPRPWVVSAIKEADIVVVPSKWEASPITVLEAMAAGTPWVSMNAGCVRENRGGLVAETPAELIEFANRLLADSELRAQLGREGRQQIRNRHDWHDIVSQHEELFARAANP
jgi:glycosyltransferase involved in cell wall biosynthesis